MRREEYEKLKKGEEVLYKMPRVSGYYRAKVVGVYPAVEWPAATLEDIINGTVFKGEGKETVEVHIEYIDDFGRPRETYAKPRQLSKDYK